MGKKILVWVLVFLHDIYPVVEFNLVDCGSHSCCVMGEIIRGSIADGGIGAFVLACLDDFDNVVVTPLFQFKVDTWKFWWGCPGQGGYWGLAQQDLPHLLGCHCPSCIVVSYG